MANQIHRYNHVYQYMFTLATIDGIHNNIQANRYKPKYLCLCMLLPSRSSKLIYSSVNAHVHSIISLETVKPLISPKYALIFQNRSLLRSLLLKVCIGLDKLGHITTVPVRGKTANYPVGRLTVIGRSR